LHILITAAGFPPERHGVANAAFHHGVGFLKKGHRVTVATGQYPSGEAEKVCLPGLEVVRFKTSGNAQIRSRYKGEINRYLDFIKSFPGDVICCHGWQTWATDLATRAFDRTPAIKILVSHGVSVNSLINWKSIPNWLMWRYYVWWKMKQMLKAFDHVVFLSRRMDNDRFFDRKMAEAAGFTRFSVIPNGADIDAHDNCSGRFQNRFGINTKFVVLCVGSYSDQKNEKMVLDAFIHAGVKDTTLVFIGNKKNIYSRSLERFWNRSEKAENSRVMFLDNMNEDTIMSAYNSADLCVCGSRTEYFPFVILDAMASSTPFISTNVGCVSDLPGGVTVCSVEEMAQAINHLISDLERRRLLGRQGCSACKCYYNWDHVIHRYDRLFRDLVENRVTGGRSSSH
jgi:glycosyltransferase involved in cell wall biosynthesis